MAFQPRKNRFNARKDFLTQLLQAILNGKRWETSIEIIGSGGMHYFDVNRDLLRTLDGDIAMIAMTYVINQS